MLNSVNCFPLSKPPWADSALNGLASCGGRWGEEVVFRLLQASGSTGRCRRNEVSKPSAELGAQNSTAEVEDEPEDEEVEWVNEGQETGLPYDIIIRRRHRPTTSLEASGDGPMAQGCDSGPQAEDCERDGIVFIEVKSTRDRFAAGPQPFPLSVNELLFALNHGPRYQVSSARRFPISRLLMYDII